jgi:hypothetical protein
MDGSTYSVFGIVGARRRLNHRAAGHCVWALLGWQEFGNDPARGLAAAAGAYDGEEADLPRTTSPSTNQTSADRIPTSRVDTPYGTRSHCSYAVPEKPIGNQRQTT